MQHPPSSRWPDARHAVCLQLNPSLLLPLSGPAGTRGAEPDPGQRVPPQLRLLHRHRVDLVSRSAPGSCGQTLCGRCCRLRWRGMATLIAVTWFATHVRKFVGCLTGPLPTDRAALPQLNGCRAGIGFNFGMFAVLTGLSILSLAYQDPEIPRAQVSRAPALSLRRHPSFVYLHGDLPWGGLPLHPCLFAYLYSL